MFVNKILAHCVKQQSWNFTYMYFFFLIRFREPWRSFAREHHYLGSHQGYAGVHAESQVQLAPKTRPDTRFLEGRDLGRNSIINTKPMTRPGYPDGFRA